MVWTQRRQQRTEDLAEWVCEELHVGCKRGAKDATEALARAMTIFAQEA